MKRIAILGSTGSIGQSALAVVDAHADRLQVVGLAAGENADLFAAQLAQSRPRVAAMATGAAIDRLNQIGCPAGVTLAGTGRDGEALLVTDDSSGRRSLKLTAEGEAYAAGHADELTAVWAPFEEPEREEEVGYADRKPEIGQVMGAVGQIVTNGSEQQRRAAVEILVDTRRRLYGVLADGDPSTEEEA